MTYEQLKQIQQVQLTIMDEVHRVCVEHDLKYYMIGGTALGAIRHNGFIPWDPDIDIAMPREDYEKFVTVYSKELKKGYSCHDYRTDRRHFSPHALVALDNSRIRFRNTGRSPFLTFGDYGIYVDILPLDRVPDDISLRKKHEKQLLSIKKWRNYKVCRTSATNSWLMVEAKVLLSLLMPVSLYRLSKWQQDIAQKYNALPVDDAKDICSTLSHYKYEKLCMPASVWGSPTLYTFEDRKYYGQEQITKYLEMLFGDYMKLPSEEQRNANLQNMIYAEWIGPSGDRVVLK